MRFVTWIRSRVGLHLGSSTVAFDFGRSGTQIAEMLRSRSASVVAQEAVLKRMTVLPRQTAGDRHEPASPAFNTCLRTIAVRGGPVYGIAITPDGARAYVTNFQPQPVAVINTKTESIIATVNVANSFAVGISEDGRRALVSNYYSTTVTVQGTSSRRRRIR